MLSANISQATEQNVEQNGDEDSEEEDEDQIFVKRQEEEHDPEAEAEFDREFDKMMAESLESRRFERKAIFDVPLPMRRPGRDNVPGEKGSEDSQPNASTMAFSLMTKKGSKQQV